MARQEVRLQRLERRQPSKITGRQVFLKDLMWEAEQNERTRHRIQESRAAIFKRHGALWNLKTEQQKEVYEAQAAAMRREAEEALEAQKVEAREAWAQAKSMLQEVSHDHHFPLLRSQCHLSPQDLKEFDDLRQGSRGSR
eukprot:3579993-Lingulodinium_polyedra.AAC.1